MSGPREGLLPEELARGVAHAGELLLLEALEVELDGLERGVVGELGHDRAAVLDHAALRRLHGEADQAADERPVLVDAAAALLVEERARLRRERVAERVEALLADRLDRERRAPRGLEGARPLEERPRARDHVAADVGGELREAAAEERDVGDRDVERPVAAGGAARAAGDHARAALAAPAKPRVEALEEGAVAVVHGASSLVRESKNEKKLYHWSGAAAMRRSKARAIACVASTIAASRSSRERARTSIAASTATR
jgi:hypothetical protein